MALNPVAQIRLVDVKTCQQRFVSDQNDDENIWFTGFSEDQMICKPMWPLGDI